MSRRLSILIIGVAALAALLGVMIPLSFIFDRPAYRMIIRPAENHGVVQFAQIDPALVTHEITVNIPVDDTRLIVLDGPDPPIRGVKIDFYDSAPSPGCFRMHLGTTKIELMEVCYRVDGAQHAWVAGSISDKKVKVAR